MLTALFLCISFVGCKSIKDIKWKAKDDTVSYVYEYEEEEQYVDPVIETMSFSDVTYGDTLTSDSMLPGDFVLEAPTTNMVMTESLSPKFVWLGSVDSTTYTIVIQKYDEGTSRFADYIRKGGIKTTEYVLEENLEPAEIYRWCIIAQNAYGETKSTGTIDDNYEMFMSKVDVENHIANSGLDFSFDGSISEKVLCNYLSRAMTVATENEPLNLEKQNSILWLRNILFSGAKYISRAACAWVPSKNEEATVAKQKEFIAYAHSIDSSLIFEACIFENITEAVNEISIPDYVFDAFGLKHENRNFSYAAMVNPEKRCPDITKLEGQMFIYHRACMYIDAGYEGLHLGQVDVIGAKEYNVWTNTTKVYNLIREYAKSNARRHFVLINAHTSYGNASKTYIGADGKLLFDFASFPLRATTDETEAHEPSKSNPQTQYLKVGIMDAIYGKTEGGLTHSGWTCSSLPYYVEFDNANGITGKLNVPTPNQMINWGRDDISWFASQPEDYREYWLNYSYNWVKNLGENGFVCLPGLRVAWPHGSDKMSQYDASFNQFSTRGNSDIFAIRSIWATDNKKNFF